MSSVAVEGWENLWGVHGIEATRRRPDGTEECGVRCLFVEDRVDRDFERSAERTQRTGMVTVLVEEVEYEPGEQWIINDEVWQVQRLPNLDSGLRMIYLRRDDKVRTVSSREQII
ncbi:hypothetical protein [Schlesneria sp.]|uniref:hypothetical protein n=1 Tax=Schlesneria sp. TaxID=2762018 RepID=UPI002F1A9CA2